MKYRDEINALDESVKKGKERRLNGSALLWGWETQEEGLG
jgi:hypothetical protein